MNPEICYHLFLRYLQIFQYLSNLRPRKAQYKSLFLSCWPNVVVHILSAEEWHNLFYAGSLNGLSKYTSIAKICISVCFKSFIPFIIHTREAVRPCSYFPMLDFPFQAHLPYWEQLLCLSGSPPFHSIHCSGHFRRRYKMGRADDPAFCHNDGELSFAFCWISGHCIPLCLIVTAMCLPSVSSWVNFFVHMLHSQWCQLVLTSAVSMGMPWCESPHHKPPSVPWLKPVPAVTRPYLGSRSSPACRFPPGWDAVTVWLLSTVVDLLLQVDFRRQLVQSVVLRTHKCRTGSSQLCCLCRYTDEVATSSRTLI